MAYVFGDMLICNDKESAQQVTFNKAVGVKSVTLDGDVYDPSGTLSGGAAPSGSGIIVKVQELKVIEKKIAEHKTALSSIEAELKRAKTVIDAFKKNKRELDLKQHEVNLLQEQVEGSNAAKIVADVDLAKKTLADLKETVASAKERQKAATVECKRLEKEMADFKNNKDSKLTELRVCSLMIDGSTYT
jgi:structural maintenance of chromosome 2